MLGVVTIGASTVLMAMLLACMVRMLVITFLMDALGMILSVRTAAARTCAGPLLVPVPRVKGVIVGHHGLL